MWIVCRSLYVYAKISARYIHRKFCTPELLVISIKIKDWHKVQSYQYKVKSLEIESETDLFNYF